MTRSYHLTFEVLLESMAALAKTASLRASLAAMHQGRQTDALAIIVAEQGTLVSCDVRALPAGVCVAQGEQARTLLMHAGSLEWQVEPRHALVPVTYAEPLLTPSRLPPPTFTTGQMYDMTSALKPVSEVDATHLSDLPSKSRQAVLLSNGRRSCSDIARLLGMTSEQTQHLLDTLSQQRLITWSS